MAEPGSHDPFGRPTAPGSRDAFGRSADDDAGRSGGTAPPPPRGMLRRGPWIALVAAVIAAGAVLLVAGGSEQAAVAPASGGGGAHAVARSADGAEPPAASSGEPGPRDPASLAAPPALPAAERRRDDRRVALLTAADRRPLRTRPPLRSFLRRDDLARALSLLQRRIKPGERAAELAVWSDMTTLLACGPRNRGRYYTAGLDNPVAVSRGEPTPIARCATVPDRAPAIDPGVPGRLRDALRRGGLADRRIASISYVGPDSVNREPFWVVHATRRGLAWIAGPHGHGLRRAPSWLARRSPPRPRARRG